MIFNVKRSFTYDFVQEVGNNIIPPWFSPQPNVLHKFLSALSKILVMIMHLYNVFFEDSS